MKKLKFRLLSFPNLLLATWISFAAYPVVVCAEISSDLRSPSSNTTAIKSKKQLAQEVSIELGIGEKYDLHLKSVVDMAIGANSKPQFRTWLHSTLTKFTGWKYVESEYGARLEANFSETELKELLELAKLPLMKKLLRAEIQAYADTSDKRLKLFQKFWEDYNSGLINEPKNLF